VGGGSLHGSSAGASFRRSAERRLRSRSRSPTAGAGQPTITGCEPHSGRHRRGVDFSAARCTSTLPAPPRPCANSRRSAWLKGARGSTRRHRHHRARRRHDGRPIKQIPSERGMTRASSAVCFRAWPLHAGTLARELNIPEVVIPPELVISRHRMLVSDARVDETHTFLRDFTRNDRRDGGTFANRETPARHARGRDRIGRDRSPARRRDALSRPEAGHRAEIGMATTRPIREVFNASTCAPTAMSRQAPIEFDEPLSDRLGADQGPRLADLRPTRAVSVRARQKRAVRAFPGARRARRYAGSYQRGALKPGFEAAGPASSRYRLDPIVDRRPLPRRTLRIRHQYAISTEICADAEVASGSDNRVEPYSSMMAGPPFQSPRLERAALMTGVIDATPRSRNRPDGSFARPDADAESGAVRKPGP